MFKIFKSKEEKRFKNLARREREEATLAATAAFNHQLELVLRESIVDSNKAEVAEIVMKDKALLHDIELEFMWGWFDMFVSQNDTLPTKGSLRVIVHMIDYLVNKHGYDFESARLCSAGLYRLHNQGDESFRTTANFGRRSFQCPDEPSFFEAIATYQQAATRQGM